MASKVVYRDLGLTSIMKRIGEIGVASIRVGIVGPEASQPAPASNNRLTIAEAALINEYGSSDGHVPERRTFRDVLTHGNAKVSAAITEMVRSVVGGAPSAIALEVLGKKLADIVRDHVVLSHIEPDNAPATVRRKGFNHPLVDTGTFAAAITYQIVRASGGVVDAGASIEEFESYVVEAAAELDGLEDGGSE